MGHPCTNLTLLSRSPDPRENEGGGQVAKQKGGRGSRSLIKPSRHNVSSQEHHHCFPPLPSPHFPPSPPPYMPKAPTVPEELEEEKERANSIPHNTLPPTAALCTERAREMPTAHVQCTAGPPQNPLGGGEKEEEHNSSTLWGACHTLRSHPGQVAEGHCQGAAAASIPPAPPTGKSKLSHQGRKGGGAGGKKEM